VTGGWPYEKDQEWRARSAVTYASELSAPLLVQHGMDDLNVPYAQIVEFVNKAETAEALNASVTFLSYEGEKHGNQKPENQEAYLRRTAEFFCEHLMPWDSASNPGARNNIMNSVLLQQLFCNIAAFGKATPRQ
jgi:dipeptidyl aminopeptidase/acylaminoacyl peptidase